MTSIVKLTALSGATDETPPCYLLQIDDFNMLLDCGWDERMRLDFIARIKPLISRIDCVLLTYPDQYHLGALPYLVGKLKMSCDIYCTVPVYKMGQLFMYDTFQSHHNNDDFSLFSLDDVDTAFDKVTQVKYSMPIALKGKGEGLTITAYPAGHMVGGAMWKITKDGEEDVVYAVDYNHKRERHLNGCSMDVMSRAHILITDAYNGTYNPEKRPVRDEQLTVSIMTTLRERGNVLICMDTAGRVLEIAQLLDQLWRNEESGLYQYSLALLNNVSYNVVEFAKSQMEWMSDRLMNQFESDRSNPFSFKHLNVCHTLQDLTKLTDPKVVLASQPDLQSGFARDLFIQWSADPRNCVIFTQRTGPGTLARLLIDRPETKALSIDVKKRVPLSGEELDKYNAEKAEREGLVSGSGRVLIKEEPMDVTSTTNDDSSDEENDEVMIERLWRNRQHDFYADTDAGRLSIFKLSRKAPIMFPHREKVVKWDDYGELINLDDFSDPDLLAKEKEAAQSQDLIIEEPPEPAQPVVQIEEKPTKCVVEKNKSIKVKCKHMFIDYEGRSDGDSIKKIIAHCKPRQLILIRCSEESSHTVVDYLKDARIQVNVFTPKPGETVDATLESFIYQVKLTDSLMAGLDWHKTKGIDLTWVDGVISKESRQEFEDSPSNQVTPLLEKLKSGDSCSHDTVFINEVRLNEFKMILARSGLNAEFVMGVLVVNGKVAIKRLKSGHISIEGCFCEEYYVVRDLLYQQFAVL